MEKEQILDDRIIKKMLRGTLVVMVAAVLSTMLGMLVDGIVIGRYLGQKNMAAYGIANPVFNLLMAVNGVLAAGIQVLCAKYIGSGEFERAKQVHTVCVLSALLIGLVLFSIIFFGSDRIAFWLGASGKDEELLPKASDYLRGLGIGVPGMMVAFMFTSFMQIDSDQPRLIVGILTMTAVNIAGDFANAMVFQKGLLGMGLATSLSYYVALIVAMTHYTKKNNVLTFTFKGLRFSDFIEMIKMGIPSGMTNLCITSRNIVMNRLLLLIAGSISVASMSIQNTLTAATGSISTGLGMAVLLVAGIVMGEQDRTSAAHLLRFAVKLGLLIAVGETIVVLAFTTPLVRIFSGSDRELTQAAVYCVRFYALGFLLNVVNAVFINYFQGMGRVKFANIITFLDSFFYSVVVAWVFGYGFRLEIGFVWAAWAIGEAMVLFTIFIMAWKKKGKIPFRAEEFTFLPGEFGKDVETSYERTVYGMEEVIDCGVEIEDFCLSYGAQEDIAKKIHLFIEELAGNIIQHGFSDGKEHSVDIRVLKKKEGWVLRLRDDCKPFDPKAWYKFHKPADVTKNTGIHIVMQMAKEVRYVNTMRLNNLTVLL